MRNALAYSVLKLYQSRGKKSSDSVACGKSRRDGGIPASLSAVYLRTEKRKGGRSPQKVLTAARVAAYITSMKITVYAISKNEEKFAARWVKSMSEADEIVVLDTGSTDDTVGILTAAGVRVKQAVIKPWRFDVARNESLKLVSEDTDVCVCTDLDEVFEPGWRAALEKSWAPDIVQGRYRYIWSHVEGGKPGVEFYAEKVHALHGFRWVNPVHEVLACSLPARKIATLEGVTLHHYPDDAKSRAAYLPLLELAVKEDPANDRNAHYLGREYYFRGRYDEAIRELRRHLALKTAVWTDERAASMRYIARCCRALNRRDEAEVWYLRAVAEAPGVREAAVELGRMLYEEGNYYGAVFFLEKALAVKSRSASYINDPDCWSALPYDLLSLSYYFIGRYPEAVENSDEAVARSNEPRLKTNREFFVAARDKNEK